MDGMIGIVYVITLKDLLYNDFTIGVNVLTVAAEAFQVAFLTFLETEAIPKKRE